MYSLRKLQCFLMYIGFSFGDSYNALNEATSEEKEQMTKLLCKYEENEEDGIELEVIQDKVFSLADDILIRYYDKILAR